jgi:hypothetical protein
MILDSPSKIVYGCILILLIVYSAVIPLEYKHFADSTTGRILGMAAVYAAVHYLGWTFGLLTAMAFLLLLHGGVSTREGFDGGGTVSEKKVIGNRWWVEKVLGEVPSAVATDRVTTSSPGGNE